MTPAEVVVARLSKNTQSRVRYPRTQLNIHWAPNLEIISACLLLPPHLSSSLSQTCAPRRRHMQPFRFIYPFTVFPRHTHVAWLLLAAPSKHLTTPTHLEHSEETKKGQAVRTPTLPQEKTALSLRHAPPATRSRAVHPSFYQPPGWLPLAPGNATAELRLLNPLTVVYAAVPGKGSPSSRRLLYLFSRLCTYL